MVMNSRSCLLDFPEDLAAWKRSLPYALLLSITAALYSASLYFSFQWDDHLYVEGNPLIRSISPAGLRAIWSAPFLGHYAPLHITLLALLYKFWGLSPLGFHVAQLLLHGVCVCLLYFLLKKLETPGIALLATLLFVVHPTNIETVAWIAETKSTLAFLFFLLAFLAFIRLEFRKRPYDAMLVAILLALSLFSKINTVVAPAIFLAYSYRQRSLSEPLIRKTLAYCFALSAIFIAIHLSSFFASSTTLARSGLEGSYYGGFAIHLLNLPFLLFFYVQMLVYPHPLTAWHMFLVRQGITWAVAGAWIILAGFVWLVFRANRNVQFWSFWFVAFLAPVLQFIPNLTWVAERYLYIPAIGMFVLFARLIFFLRQWSPELWQRWCWDGGVVAALGVLFGLTAGHVPVFRNDLTLWGAALPTCSTSAQCHAGFGESLLGEGQTARGMRELIQAVDIRPSAVYLTKLGDGFTFSAKDYNQAVIAYRMALKQTPSDGVLQLKLARALIQAGRLNEGFESLRSAAQRIPGDPAVLVVKSFLEWKQGNWDAARATIQKSLAVTSQASLTPQFLVYFWGNEAEAGQFMRDLFL